MTTKKLLIAGNWKMNGTHAFTHRLLSYLRENSKASQNEILVCPPFTSLCVAEEILKGSHIQLGAQDMSAHEKGAYTGEISAEMLADAGCCYVLVGHSERRNYYHETDELIFEKAKKAHEHGITPLVCLGESQTERDAEHTFSVISKQLHLFIENCDLLQHCVFAYEPVWAIGTGKTATPEQVQEVHAYIRQQIAKKDASLAKKIRILYGGSVNAANAITLFNMPDVDGGLIGGASLKEEEFTYLCQVTKV